MPLPGKALFVFEFVSLASLQHPYDPELIVLGNGTVHGNRTKKGEEEDEDEPTRG